MFFFVICVVNNTFMPVVYAPLGGLRGIGAGWGENVLSVVFT